MYSQLQPNLNKKESNVHITFTLALVTVIQHQSSHRISPSDTMPSSYIQSCNWCQLDWKTNDI